MKATMTKPISPRQLQALQIAIQGIGINDRQERLEWLSSQTGRTINTTKDLTFAEANRLLSHLNEDSSDKAKKILQREAHSLVSQIYKLSFLIPFLNEDYSANDTPEDVEMNKAKISVWTRKYARCHKPVSQMDVNELKAVREQMRKIINDLDREEAEP